MNKRIKNVLSVTALAAMMPIAVNAATINGDLAASSYDENVTLSGNVEVRTGDFTITTNATPADIVIDLGGHTISLGDGQFKVTNTGKKVTIQNGTITCTTNTSDCVSATTELIMNGVTVNSKLGKALNTADNATISGSNLYAKNSTTTALTAGAGKKATFANGTIKGTISAAATDLEISGSVNAPASAAQYALDGATIKANAINAAGDDFSAYTTDNSVTVDLTGINFKEKSAGTYVIPNTYTIQYDRTKKLVVNYPSSLFEQVALSSNVVTLGFKTEEVQSLANAKKAYNDLSDDEKKAREEKYTATVINALLGYTATNDVRDQDDLNSIVASLNNIVGNKSIDTDKVQDIIDNNNSSTVVDNNNTAVIGDETIDKNPQTSDSIYSVASLGFVGISALGVAVKKRFN